MPKKRTIGTGNLRRAKTRPPIDEFPDPVAGDWEDPPTFGAALDLHMRRHRDTDTTLLKAIAAEGDRCNRTTIRSWRRGEKEPRCVGSRELLQRIEARYRLSPGYFREKLSNRAHGATGIVIPGVEASERRRLAWHLPDDFDRRPISEQQEILKWVRTVIVSGATEYRRYQAQAMRDRFALKFGRFASHVAGRSESRDKFDLKLPSGPRSAPPRLQQELEALLRFKTATLTDIGFSRQGVWCEETAAQKIEHLGLLFGALSASPDDRIKGLGIPRNDLSLALLVVPAIWDWYVQWRERRRGFYTRWEVDMLCVALALTRGETGWLRQSPQLAQRLKPVAGLIDGAYIAAVQRDWDAACDRLHTHASARVKEVERVARVHRDPFEPILPILEASSPLAEYRAITEEILRRMPDARRHPRAAAEAVRSFLMLRIGLHLGVRQKNLRQLLSKQRSEPGTPERVLESVKRGEMRWSERDSGWEVLIPAAAFKNASSSYFGGKPFRLILPDIYPLYRLIDEYLGRHRPVLLNGAPDPGTFFVKSVKVSSKNAEYDQNSFYEAWRLTVARYGIYNPFTGRGAIKGLLPHGPHNLRDVLATHILKQTGSYEQASYAIQDTPEVVAQHYGRFLPQDKAALAAQVLNKAWEAMPA